MSGDPVENSGGPVAKTLPGASRRILHLTLHRRWFDEIAAGTKKEEYREVKPYWLKRLYKIYPGGRKVPLGFDEIHFRNGYAKDAPWMRVVWMGLKAGEWQGRPVFAIQLGKVLEIRNHPLARSARPSSGGSHPTPPPPEPTKGSP